MKIILMTILDVIGILRLWNMCTLYEASASFEGM